MENELLLGIMVFVILLATGQAQEGHEGDGSVSAGEPAANSADFFVGFWNPDNRNCAYDRNLYWRV